MDHINYENRRELVRNFMLINSNSKDSEVINHFKKLGFPKTSIQEWTGSKKEDWKWETNN